MIYTITLNPSIDYYVVVNESLMMTEVNRATNEQLKAGGKGINVSMLLSTLNIPSRAIALVGSFSRQFIREQVGQYQLIDLLEVPIEGMNRINLKISHNDEVLSINGKGSVASQESKREVLNGLKELNRNDWVMVCGSMMEGMGEEFLLEIADTVHTHGAKLVIDMESLTLDLLAQCKPTLIKPNFYEFGLLINRNDLTAGDIDFQVNQVLDTGVELVLISLGKDGAILATNEYRYHMKQPVTDGVNKVGTGDAMLAAFVGKLSQGGSYEEALAWGGASGSARALTIEAVSAVKIKESLKSIEVSKQELK